MQRPLLSLLALLCLPLAAWAQDGKISGTVTDRATGEPLPGATIVIDGTTRGAATDVDGEYVILNLDPGSYTLRASFVGYGSQVVQDVTVSSGFTTVVDFALSAGLELEEVVVQGERLIRQDEVSTTTVLQGEDIQALPIDNFGGAMTLAAGVVSTNSGTDQGIHIRGGRSNEVAYIVDGVLVEDPLSGSLGGFDVARQSIDELQILTGGFSARYGKAMSGIILINTPTGGNQFHGALRLETDGYSLDGIGEGGPGAGYSRPFGNDWGERKAEISLSGPILRDRITFFVNADRLDSDGYLNEFEGPVRPATFAWSELVGYQFLRTFDNSFVDETGTPIEGLSLESLGIELGPGNEITPDIVAALREAGVDVDRSARAAISNYQQTHRLGLFNDRTRLVTNLGVKVTNDIDAKLGYKMTRRGWRGYDHSYKFLPEYNNQYRRNVDLFTGALTHRLSNRVFYELRASYANNRYWDFVYDEQRDAGDPARFLRIFPDASVIGAFNTEGLSDAEGGSNYDFDGFIERFVYPDYPRFLDGDLGRPFMLSRSLDLDGDGTLDVFRRDRLTADLLQTLRNLSDEDRARLGLEGGAIPILAPPTENDYEERKMKDFQIGFDVTAQINERNMLMAGIEYRQLDIFNHFLNANVEWDGSLDPTDPDNKPWDPADEVYIDVQPFEIAAYLEDKIEFANLVIRPGLRLDVLDPAVSTVINYGAGGNVRRGLAQPEDADVKWQISPRLGVAFPITDRARLSFNYGQFLQYPEYDQLYQSIRTAAWSAGTFVELDEFGYDLGFETFVGNPNIEPERTIFYQIDGEFLVSETMKVGASLFYKDIYDYVSYVRRFVEGGDAFWVLDNLDYANARGFEIRTEKRMEEHFGFSATYTYSRAVGNADDSAGKYNDWYSNSVFGIQPPKGAKPLDWDQPHTFTFSAQSRFGALDAGLIGQFASGLPYTRTNTRGIPTEPKNNSRRPWIGTLDLRLGYDLDLGGTTYFKPFLEVSNLLDRQNVLNVFTDTGAPNYTTDPGTQYEDAQRPTYYGAPRHVTLGFTLGF